MSDDKSIGLRDFFPVLIMGLFFVIIHFLALLFTGTFQDAGMEAFEDKDSVFNLVYILIIMLVFTLAISVIAKYWKKQFIQFIILGAIGYTAFYVLYPLLDIFISHDIPVRLSIDPLLDISFTLGISVVFAIILAIVLVVVLVKFPEWYVIDFCGVIVGAGAIAIFGISLGVWLVLILLVILAIYDAISVYKTKHMIDLADTVMDLKLPVLIVVPKVRHYSLIKETKTIKEKLKDDEERDAFFMGLGDIVMPGILVVALYSSVKDGLPLAFSVMIGTLVGFGVIMFFVMKGKPQAGLPCLCGGAIAGYILGSLILYGKLVGLTFSW